MHRPFLWIVATRLSLCMIYILLQSLIERLLIFSLPYPNHFLYLVIIPLFDQFCKDDSLEFMRAQKNQIKYSKPFQYPFDESFLISQRDLLMNSQVYL